MANDNTHITTINIMIKVSILLLGSELECALFNNALKISSELDVHTIESAHSLTCLV